MFRIDRASNSITELSKKSFKELQYNERANVQEWIAKNPQSLGEPLLIIQKEFSGFNDTAERLDLLAIDTNGNLVIIENKLDDTGKDVVWQALKYASYCSTLSHQEIIDIYQRYLTVNEPRADAKQNLNTFLDAEWDEALQRSKKQRIILVAANFRKEVTSTVLWLLDYELDIQCIQLKPYTLDDQEFLSIEKILPTPGTEDYVIRMANKAQNDISQKDGLKERHLLRLEFWGKLLPQIKGKTSVFQTNNPTKDQTIYAGGSDISGIAYIFTITSTYCRVGLLIAKSSVEENKLIFDYLKENENEINSLFGTQLYWDRQDGNVRSMITHSLEGVNVFNKSDWDKMILFLVEQMIKLEQAMKATLINLRNALPSLIALT
jgi:hypothetical protein